MKRFFWSMRSLCVSSPMNTIPGEKFDRWGVPFRKIQPPGHFCISQRPLRAWIFCVLSVLRSPLKDLFSRLKMHIGSNLQRSPFWNDCAYGLDAIYDFLLCLNYFIFNFYFASTFLHSTFYLVRRQHVLRNCLFLTSSFIRPLPLL